MPDRVNRNIMVAGLKRLSNQIVDRVITSVGSRRNVLGYDIEKKDKELLLFVWPDTITYSEASDSGP